MKSYLIFSTSPQNKLKWNLNKLGGKSQTNVTVTSHLIPKSSLLSETRWSTWCTALVECSNYMVVPFLMQDLNAAGQAYMHLVDCEDVKLLTFPAPFYHCSYQRLSIDSSIAPSNNITELLASSLKEKAVGCLLGGGHLDVHVCHWIPESLQVWGYKARSIWRKLISQS